MIISINSRIEFENGRYKGFSAELYRYFERKQFKEMNKAGVLWLETALAYNKDTSLTEYMKVSSEHRIATLYYTYDSYEQNNETYFRFYLDETKIDYKLFKENEHLDLSSIRFAYPLLIGSEIHMIHIVANSIYFDPNFLLQEGE